MSQHSPNTTAAIRILMGGPMRGQMGGMQTWCEDYLRTSLPTEFAISYCPTHRLRSVFTTHGPVCTALKLLNAILVNLAWLAMLLIRRPHIAHVHTNSYAGFYRISILMLLARMLGVKTLLHIHGGEFDRFYERSSPRFRGLIRRLINVNSAAIVLSEQWRTFFLGIGVRSDKLVVLPNAVFLPEAQGNTARGAGQPVTVLYLSRLSRPKGIFELVDALGQQPEAMRRARVVLVGPREDDWQRVADLVSQMGLADRVTMPGLKVGAEKNAVYASADIYVLPSHAEGMPIGLLEAMSFGLACVTTPVGGIPEVIADGQNGLLVPATDARALGEAIARLVTDAELRTRLGAAARATVEQRYSWQAREGQLREIYHRLIG